MSENPEHEPNPPASPRLAVDHIDRLGGLASSLCAAHCLLCAVAPSLFTLLGLGALLGHRAEWGFTLLAAGLAASALLFSWRRHRSPLVAAVFAAGIGGLFLSRALEEAGSDGLGLVLGVSAGAALVLAHAINLRSAAHNRRMASAQG